MSLSGIVSTDMAGGEDTVSDIATETHLVMTTIRTLLASVVLGMTEILRGDVHLTDLDDMAAMNAVYGTFFPGDQRPARTTTQSAKMAGG
ncbi:MAG: RidA family protein [Rhodospirillales bacterium]|nr:RidA family protein [Rhodospirillales bacterium]